jgi:putative tryptophan/tyrosine transport system substrate-binding protein
MQFDQLRRREFIRLLGGAAVSWPLAVRAQQPAMPVVGFIHILSPETVPRFVPAFRQGLKEVGYVEGQNLAVEYRWAQGQYDRLPGLVADLVRRQVAVIAATGGDPSPQIAKAATQTIPIVFTANSDPVAEGLVTSLNRPGGNATGVTIFGPAAVTKRLQLLRDLMPQVVAIAYLMNPNNPNAEFELQAAQTAARSLGLEMLVLRAGTERELDTALATTLQQQADALLVASDTFFVGRREQVVTLAARHQIPAIYYLREFAEAGGLMTYGNSLPDVYRHVGVYVGRILKGEKPSELPVMQPTKFELVINLKTAKALGLDLPPILLARADEVIE